MTKNEIVYKKLKEMILSHSLDETSALNERELAIIFNSSRTPVREAINRLSDQGLLFVIPGRGTYIKKITVEDVIDIYNIKEALDSLAISLSMDKISEEQINELRRILIEMDQAAVESSTEKFFKLDIEFHNVFIRSTGSERLEKISENLNEQIIGYVIASVRSKERMDHSLVEHKTLLKAIVDKDIEKAQNSIISHMRSVKQFHIDRISK